MKPSLLLWTKREAVYQALKFQEVGVQPRVFLSRRQIHPRRVDADAGEKVSYQAAPAKLCRFVRPYDEIGRAECRCPFGQASTIIPKVTPPIDALIDLAGFALRFDGLTVPGLLCLVLTAYVDDNHDPTAAGSAGFRQQFLQSDDCRKQIKNFRADQDVT